MASTTSEHGWANLKHPELYTDLQAAGSLAAALDRVAAGLGLDVGDIQPTRSNPLMFAELGGAPQVHRTALSVTSAALVRSFVINGWSQGAHLVSGGTTDLGELVRAAAIWRSGAALADIRRACPWIEVSELACAHERGPADAVTVMWELVRAQMREGDRPFELGIRAADAAYAEPRLRQLFPYTSHWVLCFSRCTGSPHTFDVPCIGYVLSEGRYQVRWPGWVDDLDRLVLGEADTAEEAVALVVANLREECGAAVAGTRDEL